ncbi:MAG: hypothetical protein JWP28_2229 [Phenylobacterium sp.]|jgi:hypothetical protein|uniref:hypothetical protein n=1 Tax=Phenylobacterium sp. TaxID=1871053 RepID=UPI0026374173|nr:hypothetical protein [Phenylobacterium sp.]MDB5426674.1 hypothetical protein [Phenylobacterium sp.]MDB5465080.1 hypothetical protein [Phenylobacterium sp.]MDB5498198.1 hypothetical protein [Phenylobacterium sp.]
MQDELKTAGVVGLVGAALGAGVALGLGLRLFSAVAMVGLGTGIALGIVAGAKPKALSAEASPPLL